MKKLLPKLKALLLFACMLLSGMQAFAQRQISGAVTDAASGDVLIGATIQVKGTTKGTVTDMSGNYSISVESSNDVLIFSYVGYDSQEETVGDRTSINVTLSEQATQLEDVVVIGYGTVKKGDLTGSVSVVTSEDLNRTPATTFAKALQGKAPGVIVSNTSGRPGSGPSINVRGAGSITQTSNPIYVIDGVITTNLNAINPSDIESLQVLKDASATAIYGADGANGVVIITTKRGQSGKTKVHYDNYFSLNMVPKKFDLMNANQYSDFYNKLYAQDSITFLPGYTDYYVDDFRQKYYGNGWETGTDWQDLVTRTGKTQNHYLRVSGGGENSNFSISANYVDQSGILIKTDAKRYNIRANSDFTLGDHLKIGETFNISRQVVQDGDANLSAANIASPLMKVYEPENLGGFAGPQEPFWYDLNSDGIQDSTEFFPTTGGSDRDNPLAMASYRDNYSYNNSVMINLYAEYKPVSWLTYRISPSAEIANGRSYNWYPAFDEGVRSNTRSSLTEGYSENIRLMLENQLTFQKTFGDHSITATGVYQVRKNDGRSINGVGRGYAYPNLRILSLSDEADRTLTGFGGSPFRQLSYLGRLIYGYKDKILFTGSIRRDGVSKFGPSNRWGTFPSASVAYKLSEDFLQNVDQINMLKLRVGWGSTGNSAIGDFQYDDFLSGTDAFGPVFGRPQSIVPGTYIFYSFANPIIKWEAAKMWNFGVDLNALNNRIQMTAEYYIKNQNDLLVRVPVSMVFGRSGDGSQPWANAADNQNKGFEFTGTWKDYSGAFKYSVSANLTTLKNTVKYLPENRAVLLRE